MTDLEELKRFDWEAAIRKINRPAEKPDLEKIFETLIPAPENKNPEKRV